MEEAAQPLAPAGRGAGLSARRTAQIPRRTGWTPFALVATRPDGARQYQNSLYYVLLSEQPDGWTSLGIRAKHDGPIRSWDHLQRIKNELTDPEREAVELFPAESRLVNMLNESHVYVAPAGSRFPFGFTRRLVRSEKDAGHE